MKNIKAAGLITITIIACAFISETRGDDLDVRLAALERENIARKRQVRIQVLLDPATLLYAIGGWTGGRFDYQDLVNNTFFEPNEYFWANGVSAGGGLERRIGSNWALRAEYRYTQFRDVDVGNNFTFVDSRGARQTNVVQTSFENSMHVGRIGFSYLIQPLWQWDQNTQVAENRCQFLAHRVVRLRRLSASCCYGIVGEGAQLCLGD